MTKVLSYLNKIAASAEMADRGEAKPTINTTVRIRSRNRKSKVMGVGLEFSLLCEGGILSREQIWAPFNYGRPM